MKTRLFQTFFVLSFLFHAVSASAYEYWVTTDHIVSASDLGQVVSNRSDAFAQVDLVSAFAVQWARPVDESKLHSLIQYEAQVKKMLAQGELHQALAAITRACEILDQVPDVHGLDAMRLRFLVHKAEILDALHNPTAASAWREAKAWSPTAALHAGEFSPPLIKHWREMAAPQTFKLSIAVIPEERVFVDGRAVSATALALPEGRHQIATIAPGAAWKIQWVDMTKNTSMTLVPTPMVSGSCEQPAFAGAPLRSNVRLVAVLDRGACERVYDGTSWFDEKGRKLTLKDIPLDLPPAVTSMASPSLLKKLTQSPWFWVGVGAVVVGGAALLSSTQTATPTAVHE